MYTAILDAPVNTLFSRELPRSVRCAPRVSALYARRVQPESIPTYIQAVCTMQRATHSGTNAANANAHAIKIIIRIQIERKTMRITIHLRLIQGCGQQLLAVICPFGLPYSPRIANYRLPACLRASSTHTHYTYVRTYVLNWPTSCLPLPSRRYARFTVNYRR